MTALDYSRAVTLLDRINPESDDLTGGLLELAVDDGDPLARPAIALMSLLEVCGFGWEWRGFDVEKRRGLIAKLRGDLLREHFEACREEDSWL